VGKRSLVRWFMAAGTTGSARKVGLNERFAAPALVLLSHVELNIAEVAGKVRA